MLRTAFSPAADIITALSAALWPTLKAIFREPAVLLHPSSLSRLFFSKVWLAFGDPTDEGGRGVKEDLIRGRAYGVVLDIGAGHGHALDYLDRNKVRAYVAVEPSVAMHGEIRARARANGFPDSQVTVVGAGIEDLTTLFSEASPAVRPGSADTIISILTICSVPKPHIHLKRFVDEILKPGGQLLFYEHVASPKPEVRRWQVWWTPLWALFFDGCRLDRDTPAILENVGGWEKRELWGKPGEDEDSLFWHVAGRFVKA